MSCMFDSGGLAARVRSLAPTEWIVARRETGRVDSFRFASTQRKRSMRNDFICAFISLPKTTFAA